MRKTIRILSLFLICGFASTGYSQGLASLEKMLLFFPTKTLVGTPAKVGLRFDEVSLQTADNVNLHAWWIPHKQARATVILCHGNGGNISHRLEKLKIFNALKLNVLLYDYRGYGKRDYMQMPKRLTISS
jgi:pimeloyl-ACP methyl ester carboxylesterase